MAERGFTERTDRKAIGYCSKCYKPFKWHQNDLDYSISLGVQVIGKCKYLDSSEPGYGWGMASRKAAREYLTGARIENEICGYLNPHYPKYPCIKARGHDEESELGVGHDHGEVPVIPQQNLFPTFKEQNGIYIEES